VITMARSLGVNLGWAHDPPGASIEIGFPAAPSSPVRGTVRVAPAVLIQLIEGSVLDLPGVVGLRHHARGDPANHDRRTADGEGPTSRRFERSGVSVRISGNRIDADLSIAVEPGFNIKTIGQEIQRRVSTAASRMLGLTVGEVNVYVAEIDTPERNDSHT